MSSNSMRRGKTPVARLALLAAICLGVLSWSGCRSWDVQSARRLAKIASLGKSKSLSVRRHMRNPLSDQLRLMTLRGPRPSDRNSQFLRRFDLQDLYDRDPEACVVALMDLTQREQTLESMYALAEIAYLEGEKSRIKKQGQRASKMFATALIASYRYLFDPALPDARNAYDPEFRQTCDIYNQSLAGILRAINKAEKLRPGSVHTIDLYGTPIEFVINSKGRWDLNAVDRFEFVSDYETKGLKNQYNTYGLGVPLIAVRDSTGTGQPWEQYYPPGLAFPVTAFLEIAAQPPEYIAENRRQCVLHLYDPLEQTEIQIGDRLAPLESDITTPLAFFLNDPLLNTGVLPTFSLLNAEFIRKLRGLYMLEPYDPEKIPVVMVHGLWSTPLTWTEMFNDLRSDERIRKNYQFWFYLFPSGQPFWMSAQQMREDLAQAYQRLDPDSQSEALHQMVLVGHSMGGLISRLQTLESGDEFWKLVSDQPFHQLTGDAEQLAEIEKLFYFSANPSIQRVVTIGTPHHGSPYANSVTQWMGRKLFAMPDMLNVKTDQLIRSNKDLIRDEKLLRIRTSIDSLDPDSEYFAAMENASRADYIEYHNIVGRVPQPNILVRALINPGEGDGIVALESAQAADSVSELEIAEEHSNLHRHPLAILEVRRILLSHLDEFKRSRQTEPVNREPPPIPVSPLSMDWNSIQENSRGSIEFQRN